MKLLCDGKIFECHKLVLSCQSEVFETMFKSEMVESKSGEVPIDGVKADVLQNLIYFMYHDKVLNEEVINTDLLLLAHMYGYSENQR